MWLTTDTTAALVTARNEARPLTDVKEGEPPPPAPPATPPKEVTGTLEALAAVIPTGVTTIYTGAVLVLRQIAITQGTEERAALEAGLAAGGSTTDEIKAFLESIPQESREWIWARLALLAVAAVVAAVLAFTAAKAANDKAAKKRRFLLAEPMAALLAFVGWSLATPGTPLAAYHDSEALTVLTIIIGAIAALVLLGVGNLVLKKPAGGTS